MQGILDSLKEAYAALPDALSTDRENPSDEASRQLNEAETRVSTAVAALVAASEASRK
jgi:hypothetical protein